jgi:hypothetical protein
MYIYKDYNVRRITGSGAFVNFESSGKYRGFVILQGGEVIRDDDAVIAQRTSLLGKKGKFLSSENIKINNRYNNSIGFDYKVLSAGTFSVVLEREDDNATIC